MKNGKLTDKSSNNLYWWRHAFCQNGMKIERGGEEGGGEINKDRKTNRQKISGFD